MAVNTDVPHGRSTHPIELASPSTPAQPIKARNEPLNAPAALTFGNTPVCRGGLLNRQITSRFATKLLTALTTTPWMTGRHRSTSRVERRALRDGTVTSL